VHAPGFNPAPLPSTFSFKKEERTADDVLKAKQRAFGAPAHVLSTYVSQMQDAAIIPLKEVVSVSEGRAQQHAQQTLDFLQGDGAALLGYSLRMLAAHFNDWFGKHRDTMFRSNHLTDELKHALKDVPLGFDQFFDKDIQAETVAAAQSANLRLMSTTLARLAVKPRPPPKGNQGKDTANASTTPAGSNAKKGNRKRGRGNKKGANAKKPATSSNSATPKTEPKK
jgi:hypothetical protein